PRAASRSRAKSHAARLLLPAVLAVGAVAGRVVAIVRLAPVVVAASRRTPVAGAAIPLVPAAIRPVEVVLALVGIAAVLQLGPVRRAVIVRAVAMAALSHRTAAAAARPALRPALRPRFRIRRQGQPQNHRRQTQKDPIHC